MSPRLTVIMPVYNSQKYLKEAIDSVLTQSFESFQLLIIDDGSKDNSINIIKEFSNKDKRIKIYSNQKNLGIAKTRNIGLSFVGTEYFAWMDSDDIIHKDRFKIQTQFLDNNPDISICGTWIKRFSNGPDEICKSPLSNEEIKSLLIFKPAIWNATTMLRTTDIKQNNLCFDEDLSIAEDYDFFVKSSFVLKMSTVPETLYFYRRTEGSITDQFSKLDFNKLLSNHKIVYLKTLNKFKVPCTPENLTLHHKIGTQYLFNDFKEYVDAYNWILTIFNYSKNIGYYEDDKFLKSFAFVWYFVSKKSSQIGIKVFWYYLFNSFKFNNFNFWNCFKLFLRCSIKYNKF